MENNKNKGLFLKYTTYVLIIFITFILQNTPNFLEILGIKPNLLYICAVIIAMIEGEFIGGIFGIVAGMFCDLGSYNIFGFNTIFLLIVCVAIGLAVIYYIKNSKINALILSTIVLISRALIEFFFVYMIWNLEDVNNILINQLLPTAIYSLIFVIPIYIMLEKICVYYNEKYNID
ncbi:MAG: rod shape-determining protein MreD [Oscillospiraceae bacterium]